MNEDRRIDLTGRRFGRFIVEEWVGGHGAKYRCRCDCGMVKMVCGSLLCSGRTKSCGCLRREVTGKRARHHGLNKTPTHTCWVHIRSRCENPKNAGYYKYGARGIRVCERWRKFENFLADMGPRPSPKHSIDRIDNDGNYEPGNCRWADALTQLYNRRHRSPHGFGVEINRNGTFTAVIAKDGVKQYLGTFKTTEEAGKARREAERRLWGHTCQAS